MKVYIIGSVGSGKTTLSRRIAHEWSLPSFETDQFVWERRDDGDRRSPKNKGMANSMKLSGFRNGSSKASTSIGPMKVWRWPT